MKILSTGLHALVGAFLLATPTSAFVTPSLSNLKKHHALSRSGNPSLCMSTEGGNNVVVISPPGGIGEVTAVESAKRGASVRWFVISSSSSSNKVSFSEESLQAIASAGGKVDLAGSNADALLLSSEDPNSAIPAVSSWCAKSDAVIASLDATGSDMDTMEFEQIKIMESAIKIAAEEACKSCAAGGVKVAVLPIEDMENESGSDGEGGENPVNKVFSSLLAGNRAKVPPTLKDAMGNNAVRLRYGELFGLPETSKDASPFVGGPRRDPILRDEYTNRAIRLDPSITVFASPTLQSKTKSSRLSIGEAASLLALKVIPSSSSDTDVCIASLRGSERLTEDEWTNEFTRAEKSRKESTSSGAQLFTAEFGSVPNKDRFANWLATKWAPAILRTYDIAGIRVGARPVYASRTEGTGVEIVWQQLVDFEPKTVGKMQIDILEDGTGLVARRTAGNASQGYGQVSVKPLAGEEYIVRSLSDAAAQAVEKGLAIKPTPVKAKKPVKATPTPAAKPTTTVVSSGTVATETAPATATLESGPRSAGARRSSERSRGKRRKRVADATSEDDNDTEAFQ